MFFLHESGEDCRAFSLHENREDCSRHKVFSLHERNKKTV